jgi:hypothetical protein
MRRYRFRMQQDGFWQPETQVTDDLRSYHAAAHDLGIKHRHRGGRWRDNAIDNASSGFAT